MEEHKQPKLLRGPVFFEAGPGWGGRLKSWLQKHCKMTIAFLMIVAFIMVVSVIVHKFGDKNSGEQETSVIIQTIQLKDSKTLVARKALTQYLEKFPESLSNGQRVFIEDALRRNMATLSGISKIEFKIEDLKTAISRSRQLSPAQLQTWEGYARNVKF